MVITCIYDLSHNEVGEFTRHLSGNVIVVYRVEGCCLINVHIAFTNTPAVVPKLDRDMEKQIQGTTKHFICA